MPDDRLPPPRDPSDPPESTPGGFDSMNMPFREPGGVDLLLDGFDPVRTQPLPRHRATTAAAVRQGGSGRAVLVVDSTPIARKFLSTRLQSLGYQVHIAEDGEQALAMVEQQAFAIVFTEATLGPLSEIDGLGLCQAIKRKTDHPRGIVPAVVMTSGLAGAVDKVRGALAGCDAYLNKPLTEAEFIAALHEVDPLFD